MPLHKNRPSTRKPCGDNAPQFASGTGPLLSTTSNKSSQAAIMAQELASQASWADAFAPATPATTATPAESVADTQSQLDAAEPPPSYEASRLERELPSLPQMRQENVCQESSYSMESPMLDPYRDVDFEAATPSMRRDQQIVRNRKQNQRRFIVVFLVMAIWLMVIQAIRGVSIGFWRADGTPIPPLPHRNYTRHETSQSITGTFTFYDELDLSTSSGAINIVIDPQPSDKVGVIRLTTRSGSIKVRFSDEYIKGITGAGILDRVYDIEIRSNSGSQVVDLPQGNGGGTSLISDSGSITAKFYVMHLGRDNGVSRVITQSSSGTQQIKYKPISTEAITSLAARHYAKGSASLKVFMPSSWEGMVHASVGGSGSVDVKGDNLQYQRNGTKEIYAWRVQGDGKGEKQEGQVVEVRGDGSGSIKVDCSAS